MVQSTPAGFEPFVDAHHHLWKLDELDYGWLKRVGEPKPFGDPTPIQRDYLPAEFLKAARPLGWQASVHVQCDPGLPDPATETAWLQSLADDRLGFGLPQRVVGFVDLTRDDVDAVIDRHARAPNFCGVRHIVARLEGRPEKSFAKAELLEDRRFLTGLDRVRAHGLSFDLQLYPEQAESAAKAFKRLEGLRFVVDHAGGPHDLSNEGLKRWQGGLELLAGLPNGFVKFSGLGMFAGNWSVETGRKVLDGLLESFGPSRTMFGSNFPVDSLFMSYGGLVERTRALTADLSDDERQAFWRGSARAAYFEPAL